MSGSHMYCDSSSLGALGVESTLVSTSIVTGEIQNLVHFTLECHAPDVELHAQSVRKTHLVNKFQLDFAP